MQESSSIDPDLVLSHTDWLLGLTQSLARADGEDLAQATWLAALSSRSEQQGNFRAWLRAIAGNLARRQGKRQAQRARVESRAAHNELTPSTHDMVNRAEIQQRVLDEVMRLPQVYRDTVLMRYFEGSSIEELSRRMAVPSSTGRTRLARALDRLRAGLDKDYGERSAWTSLVSLPALQTGSECKEILLMTSKAKLTAAALGTTLCGIIAWQSLGISTAGVTEQDGALSTPAIAAARPAEVEEQPVRDSDSSRKTVQAEAPASEDSLNNAPISSDPILRPMALAWLDVEDASTRLMQGSPMLADFAKVAEDLLARIDAEDFAWSENNSLEYAVMEDPALGKASLHVNPGLEGKAGEFEIRIDLESTPGFPIPEDAEGSRLELKFGVSEGGMNSCSAMVQNHLRWDDEVNQRHLGRAAFLAGASLSVSGDTAAWRPLSMKVVRHDGMGIAHQNRMGGAQDLYVGSLDDPRMLALAKRLQDFRFKRR